MMKNILLATTVLLFLSSFTPATKKQSLFNGKDLTGWTIYGTEKWYVEKGNLVCESGPDKKYGYLATNKFYKDFDLTVEFLQESNGNSGIFFRSTIEGTKIAGWQCEVAPKDHDSGGIYESYGRGYTLNRGKSFVISDKYELSGMSKAITSSNLITYCKVSEVNPGLLKFDGDGFSLNMSYNPKVVTPKIEFIEVTDSSLKRYWPNGVTRVVLEFINPGLKGGQTVTFIPLK